MRFRFPHLAFAALIVVAPLLSAQAQTANDRSAIMRPELPEPWLGPKYQSPRGTPERVVIPKSGKLPRAPRANTPPSIYVPETGRVLPNMPTVSPSGPGGRETYQDRAARCAHQAGAYGAQAGDRNNYIGTCINQ